jgi:hypothetical protein
VDAWSSAILRRGMSPWIVLAAHADDIDRDAQIDAAIVRTHQHAARGR